MKKDRKEEMRIYWQKPEVKARARILRKKNRKNLNKSKMKWRENNIEKNRTCGRNWRINNKEKVIELRNNYRKNHPKKHKSHYLASKIKIPFGEKCEICKKNLAQERHHPNYNEPLEVMFLCVSCHRKLHSGDTNNAK